jgi:four helix bundle protein
MSKRMGKRFEELKIRELAQELINDLWIIFYNKDFKNRSFQDQIMRACISIANNIAEGNERGSNKDFIKFLYYSKWSVWEVRNMLYSAHNFWYITQKWFEDFKDKCLSLWTKISNFIKVLKD